MNWYDREGKELTRDEWLDKFSDEDYQVVRHDTVNGIVVSTVWLGINYNFSGEGAPIIFETMIFGGIHDQYQERYTTEDMAIKGHERALNMVR